MVFPNFRHKFRELLLINTQGTLHKIYEMPGAVGKAAGMALAGMALAADAFQITPSALPGTQGAATPLADAGLIKDTLPQCASLPSSRAALASMHPQRMDGGQWMKDGGQIVSLTRADGRATGLRTTTAACSRLRASAVTSAEQQQGASDAALPACLSKNGGRAIAAGEVLAVQKQVQGLSDTSIETWLSVRGFSTTDTEVMIAKLKDAGKGQLELAPWDRDLVDADKMTGERDAPGSYVGVPSAQVADCLLDCRCLCAYETL